MKKPFRDAYDRELSVLREQAAEFARDYPDLAGRLGGLLAENMDPAIAGLLEGGAFMAARVQLKMEEEYRTFTQEMLDQLLPGIQDPIPAAMLVKAQVPCADPDIVRGIHFDRGEYIEAVYSEDGRRVPTRFSLCAPLSLWPLGILSLSYLSTQGQIGVYQPTPHNKARGGVMLELCRLGKSGKPEEREPIAAVAADSLVFHLTAEMDEAIPLYEQIHSGTLRVSLRWEGEHSVEVVDLPADAVSQIGFGARERLLPQEVIETDLGPQTEALFPDDDRGFSGFALLREAFVFPRRFLGFRLSGLQKYLTRNPTSRIQIIFEFDRVDSRLQTRLGPEDIQLNAAPAVNLFIEDASPARVDRRHHEVALSPLSTPISNYEFHRITDVWAQTTGAKTRRRVYPLYEGPSDGRDPRQSHYFTQRRKPRRPTQTELEKGVPSKTYLGTETLVSLYEPAGETQVTRVEARGWCSNRHLPDVLPIREGRDDFFFCDQSDIRLSCISGPTPARAALTEARASPSHQAPLGDAHWRLLSYLQLNAQGISGRSTEEATAALREMLILFTDANDTASKLQIMGVSQVEVFPETGQIPHAEGFLTVRGLRVVLTFDETAFEGSGFFLLGAILDRFLADYAGVNSFTRTVIRSLERGDIHAFPRRLGGGRVL